MAAKDQTDDLLSKENVKDAAMFGAEFIPGVGEALAIKRTSDALDKKDYLGAGIEATAGLLGIIPGVGDLAGKGLRTVTKAFRKTDVEEAEKLVDDSEKLLKWRKDNKLPESQRQKNMPEAEQAAEDLFQGKIKSKEARQKIKEVFPEPKLYTAETMPDMPTVTEVAGSMGKKALTKGVVGVKGFDLKPGQRVGARLDIPAYNEYNKWVVSIHDGDSKSGSVLGYGQAIRLKNITFGSDPKTALDIARRKVIKEADPVKGTDEKRMGKATIARVFGDYVPEDPYELQMFAKKVLADKDSGWTQVGMNPYRGSYFYDKPTGNLVTSADEVIQVGPLVLAKNVVGLGVDKKPTLSEVKSVLSTPVARTKDGKLRTFNEGGVVPMDRQMEMFEDGGLMDEGGTVDPVSGNDVPPGSTQEEVRDDIPAQLSEGEFVFPADVVRYIGLGNLMRMRQEAKMGLKLMDEMGQMGNSEEATMPDDLPFDINDLDTEDEPEYNVGGFVPGQGFPSIPPGIAPPNQQVPNQQFGISGYTPAAAPTTGFTQAASQQFVQPTAPVAAAAVPTMQQYTPAELPSFQSFVGGEFGGYDELREYRNEAGNVIQVPFKDGQPISPIPEGYTFVDPEAIVTEEVTTTPTTVETATVREDDPSDPPETPGGATVAFGGTLNKRGRVDGAYLGNISYQGLDFGEARSRAMGGFGQFFSEDNITPPLPEGATAVISNLKLPKDPGDIRPAEVMNARLQVDSNFFNKTIANTNVTDRRDLEETVDYIRDKYSDDFLNDSDNIINVQQEFRQMQEEKDAKAAREQLAEARRRQERDDDDSGFDAIIDAAVRSATEEVARDYGGDDDDLGFVDSSPSSSSDRENRESDAASAPRSSSGGPGQTDFSTPRGSTGRGRRDYNAGGLASKSKPKAKKMKRGGLASKK